MKTSGKTCHRKFCLGKRCQRQPSANPFLCTKRLIDVQIVYDRDNLSNTQFRYQLVFFVHIYGYIWLAEVCLWHLLPRQNLQWHLLCKTFVAYLMKTYGDCKYSSCSLFKIWFQRCPPLRHHFLRSITFLPLLFFS